MDSSIPLQLINESDTSLYVGIVVIVLSKFWTLTVERFTSITVPSASDPFIVIQSPILTVSLTVIWILETKPSIVSLNTRIIIADNAPRDARKVPISLPVRTDRISIIPMNQRNIITTWI